MNNKIPIWFGIGGAIILVMAVAVYYQDYLSTRVLTTKVRTVVKQGESVTLNINAAKAPSVKIDLCQEIIKNPKCQTLVSKITGTQANVTIPSAFPIGKAVVKIQERDRVGKLTGKIQPLQAVIVDKAPEITVQASGNSSSGSSSGGELGSGLTIPAEKFELVSVCYDGADDSVHISWKPTNTVLRYRKVGEPTWLNPVSEYPPPANPYEDEGDTRRSVIYTAQNDLPVNTEFEFYFSGSTTSQIYQYNTGNFPWIFPLQYIGGIDQEEQAVLMNPRGNWRSCGFVIHL